MEINNLQIISSLNIPGTTNTNDVQGNEFFQILADMTLLQLKGLTDTESLIATVEDKDGSFAYDLNKEEETHENILFNPIYDPLFVINHQNSGQDLSLSTGNHHKIPISETIETKQDYTQVTEKILDIDCYFLTDFEKIPVQLKSNNEFGQSIAEEISINFNTKATELETKGNKDILTVDRGTKDVYEIYGGNQQNYIIKDFTIDGLNLEELNIVPRDIDLDNNLQRISDTFIELMDLRTNGEDSSMKVKLYPEELGYIDISLKMDEGKLVAKIMVENEQVRELFNNHINILNDKLIRQDINVSRLDIDLNLNTNGHTSSENHQEHGRNSFNKYKEIFSIENTSNIISNDEYIFGSNVLNILA